MSNPTVRGGILRSLRERLLVLLSIGILPLGVVAVVQTAEVVAEAKALEESDLLARTLQAAANEQAVLRRSFGAASALASTALAVGLETPLCTTIMQDFVGETDPYIFAGFISPDGVMRCSSAGEILDLSGLPSWAEFVADPRPMTAVNLKGAATGQSVVITTVPVFTDAGDLLGAASLSVPHQVIDTLFEDSQRSSGVALISPDGTILSASTGIQQAEKFERLNVGPEDLSIPDGGITFEYETPEGASRLAALVPLLEDRVFVLGLWDEDTPRYAIPFLGTPAPLFPILMWAAALGLAVLAVDRLILRHLNEIDRKMSGFSLEDPKNSFAELDNPPSEISSIAHTYNKMVSRIVHDAAVMEDNAREQELLLREIHHRVKNNLQLIASILNMQMRTVPDGEAKRILRRVQDRVMSLSSIHKALYSGATVDNARVDLLLQEVVGSTFSLGLPAGSGVKTDKTFEQVFLDADQAVPVALLANELVTNAVKYVGTPPEGPPWIRVSLTQDESTILLEVENSLGDDVQRIATEESTGLGSRLIDAFVTQLGAEIDHLDDGATYKVTVRFTALSAEQDVAAEVEALPVAVKA